MEDFKAYIATAKHILDGATLDKAGYSCLENFVLKNGSRFATNPEFEVLKSILGEIAHKFDVPSIDKLQEGFGANSCAQ